MKLAKLNSFQIVLIFCESELLYFGNVQFWPKIGLPFFHQTFQLINCRVLREREGGGGGGGGVIITQEIYNMLNLVYIYTVPTSELLAFYNVHCTFTEQKTRRTFSCTNFALWCSKWNYFFIYYNNCIGIK